MAGVLGLQPPISAKQIRSRASFSFLPGWEPVTVLGISKNEQAAVWHAGHTTDVLPIDSERLLVASASAGVWLVSPDESVGTTPLSLTWPKVDIRCLGRGNRGSKHFFAAGDEGALFESGTLSLRAVSRLLSLDSARDMAARLKLTQPFSIGAILNAPDAPIFDWKQIPFADRHGALIGQPINRLVCMTGLTPAKLVVATDVGVFWSDVPASGQGYRFVRAEGIPASRCWGVAETIENTVVASPTGDAASPKSNGIYFGTWQGNRLVLQRATHQGDIDFRKWNDTMLQSSAGNRSILYAVASDNGSVRSLKRTFQLANLVNRPLSVLELAGLNAKRPISVLKLLPGAEAVYTVIRSKDGAKTWAPVGPHATIEESVAFPRFPGFYQYGTLCIAVSHTDPDTIAVGTRTGPLIGRNTPGAFLWEDHGDEDTPGGAGSPHLHGDLHGLAFDPGDPTGRTLYICGDGGFVLTKDLCQTFFSLVNRTLPNLQFQSYPAHPYLTPFASASNGASGSSLSTRGLVAGPLQDNGVVFSFQLAGSQTQWQVLTSDDDGLLGIFLKGDLLLFWNNDQPTARVAKSLGARFGPEIEVTVRTPSPRVGAGSKFSQPFAEPVFRPGFRKSDTKQLMIGAAAYDANGPFQDLWGLFADDDGGNPVWDFLASLDLIPGDTITAAASDDGFTVLAGTQIGQIFTLDVRTGVVRGMPFGTNVSVPSGQVFQFAFLSGGSAIARYQGGLLRLDPASGNWVGIGGNGLPSAEGALFFMAVDAARDPNVLYLGTDFGVHASWDAGANWLPVSQGLPARSHSATLRCVTEPDGKRRLYLFTFGWSAWRTLLN